MSVRSGGLAGFVAVVWGLCFVLIQAALPNPAPLLLAGLRAELGGAVLGVGVVFVRWRTQARPIRTDGVVRAAWSSGLPSISLLILLALTNAAVALGAMYLAAGQAQAAVASILAGGQPVVLAAAGWAFFGERTSPQATAGLAIAMAGVVVVAASGSGATSAQGVVLALLATTAPAAGTIVMRRLGTSVDLLKTTSLQFLLGGALLLGTSALIEPWDGLTWTGSGLAALLVLGVLGTGAAYLIWFWLLGRTSLVRLGTALFLIPVVGVAAGILTGDRPPPLELTGIGVLLLGIGFVSLGHPSPTRNEAAQ